MADVLIRSFSKILSLLVGPTNVAIDNWTFQMFYKVCFFIKKPVFTRKKSLGDTYASWGLCYSCVYKVSLCIQLWINICSIFKYFSQFFGEPIACDAGEVRID